MLRELQYELERERVSESEEASRGVIETRREWARTNASKRGRDTIEDGEILETCAKRTTKKHLFV